MQANNRKLLYAWGIFLLIAAVFVACVEMRHCHRHSETPVYQYKVVINEDISVSEDSTESTTCNQPVTPHVNLESLLYEETQCGLLPRVSPDGVRVLDAYSAKVNNVPNSKKIKVAVVVTDDNVKVLSQILESLDHFKVSFVLPHYLNKLQEYAKAIKEHGHEIFIQLPTQSSIPASRKSEISPFLANANKDDTIMKLNCLLSATKYVIGVANVSPTLLTKSKSDMSVIFDELSRRGLAFLNVEKNNIKDMNQEVESFSDFVIFSEGFDSSGLRSGDSVLVPLDKLNEFIQANKGTAILPISFGMPHVSI